ncbi:progonadoliberin-2 isoform X1 [Loxodonta africana]|uniref:progonadoliberin-2 isoform X1 n=1 Tax=Loxodonta africana TaxID=9785 RepID=UPI0030D0A975
MASCRLDFLLLLLLLTAHPTPSKAQHWSHGWYPGGKRASVTPWGLQLAPGLPGSPHQTARSLPSGALTPPEDLVPWEGTAVAQPPLRGKQRLVQPLLVSRVRGPEHWNPAQTTLATVVKGWGLCGGDETRVAGPASATCFSLPLLRPEFPREF